MTIKIRYILLLAMAFFVIIACSKDEVVTESPICNGPEIVYEDVKGVIAASCGYTGCHNGINEADYNTFAGLEIVLSNGEFSSRTLISRDMPLGDSSLLQIEIDLLKCWEQNGFSQF